MINITRAKRILDFMQNQFETFENLSRVRGAGSFRDIAGNLLYGCKLSLANWEDGLTHDHKSWVLSLYALKTYFRLLRRFPKFREAELSDSSSKCYFPQFQDNAPINPRGYTQVMNEITSLFPEERYAGCNRYYIYKARQELEGIPFNKELLR